MFNCNLSEFPNKHKYEIDNNSLYILKNEYNKVTESFEAIKYKIPYLNKIKDLLLYHNNNHVGRDITLYALKQNKY